MCPECMTEFDTAVRGDVAEIFWVTLTPKPNPDQNQEVH